MHVCRDGRWAAKPKPRWEPSLRHRVSSVRWSSCRRNLQLLFLVALVYFLVHQLPAPPEWKNDTRADRPAPRYDVESRPRFLHHSRFRQDPDVEYEARLTHALQRIERDALAKDGNKYGSQDRIWQIMLRRDSSIINRNPDSVEFEEQNDDWEYSVSLHQNHVFGRRLVWGNQRLNEICTARTVGNPRLGQRFYHQYPLRSS